MTWLHAQELDDLSGRLDVASARGTPAARRGGRAIMTPAGPVRRGWRGRRPGEGGRQGCRSRRRAKDVDRTGALSKPSRPWRPRRPRCASPPWRPRAAPARAQGGREGRGVRAARAVCRAAGMALARDLHEPAPSKKRSVACLAVAAGDHDRVRAERVDRPRQLLGLRAARVRSAGEHRGLGKVRGDDRDPRQQAVAQRGLGVRRRAGARRSRQPSPGRARRRVPDEVERRDDGRDRLGAAEHADLDRVHADVLGHRAHLLDDCLGRSG